MIVTKKKKGKKKKKKLSGRLAPSVTSLEVLGHH